MPARPRYRCWIDRGGTFTDCVLHDAETQKVVAAKLPSSDDAPIVALRHFFNLGPDDPIPPCELRLGSTIATNALLEGREHPTIFITNEGFGDVLEIGDQRRPELFASFIEKPRPLYRAVVEVSGRAFAHRAPPRPLGLDELRRTLDPFDRDHAIAICLLYSFDDPQPERSVARICESMGFSFVTTSSELNRERGFLVRAQATVLNACLTPSVRAYLRKLQAALPNSTIRVMQSHGGLSTIDRFLGRDAALSGPAGGAVASLHVSRSTGQPLIGIDMGGTSTDVLRCVDELPIRQKSVVADQPIPAATVDVHTVAAGGGSICHIDAGRLVVGPESVGAVPGPLAYGHPEAHNVSLTDAALCLGRIVPHAFPIALDKARAAEAIKIQAASLGQIEEHATERLCEGFVQVAVDRMAAAIRKISTERGLDPRTHSLLLYGGAAAQYGCLVARELGMSDVIVHPLAGVFCAFGIGLSEQTWRGAQSVTASGFAHGDRTDVDDALRTLNARATNELGDEIVLNANIRSRVSLRYVGSRAVIEVDVDDSVSTMKKNFSERFFERFGYARNDRIEAVTVSMTAHFDRTETPAFEAGRAPRLPLSATAPLWQNGRFVDADMFHRAELTAETRVCGPAILVDDATTIVVDEGCVARIDETETYASRSILWRVH
ncbi:MAG: hydantoinase/oxoprolinase family protein [Polyangiales bacterium]